LLRTPLKPLIISSKKISIGAQRIAPHPCSALNQSSFRLYLKRLFVRDGRIDSIPAANASRVFCCAKTRALRRADQAPSMAIMGGGFFFLPVHSNKRRKRSFNAALLRTPLKPLIISSKKISIGAAMSR